MNNLPTPNAPLAPVVTVSEVLSANGVREEAQKHIDAMNEAAALVRELEREVQTDMVVARRLLHFMRFNDELQWLNDYAASMAVIEKAKKS